MLGVCPVSLLLMSFGLRQPTVYSCGVFLFSHLFYFTPFYGCARDMENKGTGVFCFCFHFCLKFLLLYYSLRATRALRPIPVIFTHLLFFVEYHACVSLCHVPFSGQCWRRYHRFIF
ncbi:hypothetical protein HOY80DRAFT_948584 [Tuber brumale]|nr:hypothetical protein HOY80DRAFT_948584 [Tuber brumale]